jgi:hypothetical protein
MIESNEYLYSYSVRSQGGQISRFRRENPDFYTFSRLSPDLPISPDFGDYLWFDKFGLGFLNFTNSVQLNFDDDSQS